ncbi:hypothetical protein [Streptomyces beijiangensis]|uniref:Uncharacterized protein n=1 Tax=Streptomyces beijiangensis TaxID=163361 RepID=A0A939FFU8_9ACTN|nr:hypothetical protein [Streptomyces beijiangensis]MBO0516315.1 hypothetical protein [Streptomyces beijiangensis]
MPSWITSRRLGAAALLYAVFVGGWYLGQPLMGVGCEPSALVLSSDAPDAVGEPGDISGDVSRAVSRVVTYDFIATEDIVPCRWEPRPRLLAWVLGDWR